MTPPEPKECDEAQKSEALALSPTAKKMEMEETEARKGCSACNDTGPGVTEGESIAEHRARGCEIVLLLDDRTKERDSLRAQIEAFGLSHHSPTYSELLEENDRLRRALGSKEEP